MATIRSKTQAKTYAFNEPLNFIVYNVEKSKGSYTYGGYLLIFCILY